MSEPLADVEALAVRLGVTLEPDSPRGKQAYAFLQDVSVEARELAKHPEWTAANVPERAKMIVLTATRRYFQNPEGYLTRQAGAFSTTKAAGIVTPTFFNEDEESKLKAMRDKNGNGLWVLSTTRGDDDFPPEPRLPLTYTHWDMEGYSFPNEV